MQVRYATCKGNENQSAFKARGRVFSLMIGIASLNVAQAHCGAPVRASGYCQSGEISRL